MAGWGDRRRAEYTCISASRFLFLRTLCGSVFFFAFLFAFTIGHSDTAKAQAITCTAISVLAPTTLANDTLVGTSDYTVATNETLSITVTGVPGVNVVVSLAGTVVANVSPNGTTTVTFTASSTLTGRFTFIFTNNTPGQTASANVTCTQAQAVIEAEPTGISSADAAAQFDAVASVNNPETVNFDVFNPYGIPSLPVTAPVSRTVGEDNQVNQGNQGNAGAPQPAGEDAGGEETGQQQQPGRRNTQRQQQAGTSSSLCRKCRTELTLLRAQLVRLNFNRAKIKVAIEDKIVELNEARDEAERLEGAIPAAQAAADAANAEFDAALDAALEGDKERLEAEAEREARSRAETDPSDERLEALAELDKLQAELKALEALRDAVVAKIGQAREAAPQLTQETPDQLRQRAANINEEVSQIIADGGSDLNRDAANTVLQVSALAVTTNTAALFFAATSINPVTVGLVTAAAAVEIIGALVGFELLGFDVFGALTTDFDRRDSLIEQGEAIKAFLNLTGSLSAFGKQIGDKRKEIVEARARLEALIAQDAADILAAKRDQEAERLGGSNDKLRELKDKKDAADKALSDTLAAKAAAEEKIEQLQNEISTRDPIGFDSFDRFTVHSGLEIDLEEIEAEIETLEQEIEQKQVRCDIICKGEQKNSFNTAPAAPQQTVRTASARRGNLSVDNTASDSAHVSAYVPQTVGNGIVMLGRRSVSGRFDLRALRAQQAIMAMQAGRDPGAFDPNNPLSRLPGLFGDKRFNVFASGSASFGETEDASGDQDSFSYAVSGGMSWLLLPNVNVGLAGRYSRGDVDSAVSDIDTDTWGISAFVQSRIAKIRHRRGGRLQPFRHGSRLPPERNSDNGLGRFPCLLGAGKSVQNCLDRPVCAVAFRVADPCIRTARSVYPFGWTTISRVRQRSTRLQRGSITFDPFPVA